MPFINSTFFRYAMFEKVDINWLVSLVHWKTLKLEPLWVNLVSTTEDVVEMVKDRSGCYDPTGEKVIRPVKSALPNANWEWEVVARKSAFLAEATMTPRSPATPYPEPVELSDRVVYNDGFPRLVFSHKNFRLPRNIKLFLFRCLILLLISMILYYVLTDI